MILGMRQSPGSFIGAVFAALLFATSAAADGKLVVVELFTSQGCSSCPPAEAYMRELAKRDDVIGLEFHVDYWDFIGWKDPFAKKAFTARQEGYVRSLRARYKYTPQAVVGGTVHLVGSNRGGIEAEISRQKAKPGYGPKIVVRKENGQIIAKVGGAHVKDTYDIVFLTFDNEKETRVMRGENRGLTLANARVVREFEIVGTWRGAPVTRKISILGRDGDGGCAILVQRPNHGRIIAAATLPFGG